MAFFGMKETSSIGSEASRTMCKIFQGCLSMLSFAGKLQLGAKEGALLMGSPVNRGANRCDGRCHGRERSLQD